MKLYLEMEIGAKIDHAKGERGCLLTAEQYEVFVCWGGLLGHTDEGKTDLDIPEGVSSALYCSPGAHRCRWFFAITKKAVHCFPVRITSGHDWIQHHYPTKEHAVHCTAHAKRVGKKHGHLILLYSVSIRKGQSVCTHLFNRGNM